MRIFQVGRDALQEWEWAIKEDDYEWFVYDYEDAGYGGYDGYGQAVALRRDGVVVVKSLDHCSCYGPMDCWETSSYKVTVEEFLREKDSIHDIRCSDAIMSKAKELFSGMASPEATNPG